MTVSGFRNIAVGNIELLMLMDVEKFDAYGMHSVPSTSGNPPGGFSGKGVVEKEQLELICNKVCNEKSDSIST